MIFFVYYNSLGFWGLGKYRSERRKNEALFVSFAFVPLIDTYSTEHKNMWIIPEHVVFLSMNAMKLNRSPIGV